MRESGLNYTLRSQAARFKAQLTIPQLCESRLVSVPLCAVPQLQQGGANSCEGCVRIGLTLQAAQAAQYVESMQYTLAISFFTSLPLPDVNIMSNMNGRNQPHKQRGGPFFPRSWDHIHIGILGRRRPSWISGLPSI